MKAVNDFLLNLFTGTDELRKNLMFPNSRDGIVYATDSRVVIAIPQESLALSYSARDNFPNAERVFADLESSNQTKAVKIKVSDLAKELTRARIKTDKFLLECKECEGSGEVKWKYDDKEDETHYENFECPKCEGHGKEEHHHQFPRISLESYDDKGFNIKVKVGKLMFAPFQLFRVFMVALARGKEEVELRYTGLEEGCLVVVDEIRMIVMPLLIKE